MPKKQTKVRRAVSIVRSETFFSDTNLKEIQSILDEAIADFLDENERIINIEVKEHCGMQRFWIYSENNK